MGEMADYYLEQIELQDLFDGNRYPRDSERWKQTQQWFFDGQDPWGDSQSNGLVTKIGHRSVCTRKRTKAGKSENPLYRL